MKVAGGPAQNEPSPLSTNRYRVQLRGLQLMRREAGRPTALDGPIERLVRGGGIDAERLARRLSFLTECAAAHPDALARTRAR